MIFDAKTAFKAPKLQKKVQFVETQSGGKQQHEELTDLDFSSKIPDLIPLAVCEPPPLEHFDPPTNVVKKNETTNNYSDRKEINSYSFSSSSSSSSKKRRRITTKKMRNRNKNRNHNQELKPMTTTTMHTSTPPSLTTTITTTTITTTTKTISSSNINTPTAYAPQITRMTQKIIQAPQPVPLKSHAPMLPKQQTSAAQLPLSISNHHHQNSGPIPHRSTQAQQAGYMNLKAEQPYHLNNENGGYMNLTPQNYFNNNQNHQTIKLEVNPHPPRIIEPPKKRRRKHGPNEPIKIRGLTRTELAKSSLLWAAEVDEFVKILPGERKNSYKFIAGRHVFHQCGPKLNGKLIRYDDVKMGDLVRVQCGVRRCTAKGSFVKCEKPKWIVKPSERHEKHETEALKICSLGRLGMRAPDVAERLLLSRKAMSTKVLTAENLRGVSRKILGEVKEKFGDCQLDDVNEMLYIRRKIRRLKGRCNKFNGEI